MNKKQAQAIINYIDAKIELLDMSRANPEYVISIQEQKETVTYLREQILNLSQPCEPS